MREIIKKFAGKTGLAPLFMAAALALPLAGASLTAANAADPGPGTAAAAALSGQTGLGYIVSGNPSLTQMSEAGMRGLAMILNQRTSVRNAVPIAVEPGRTDLTLLPMIYWAIDPNQPLPSQEAVSALNRYMADGGTLVIDTRRETTSGRGAAWLRRAIEERGLDIGRLVPAPGCVRVNEGEIPADCHVLGKSFYLLSQFPGRYAQGPVYIEETNEFDHDGISPVVIGENEYAAAWAVDADGRYLYSVNGDEKQREQAFRFGINLVMYVLTGNYKADQAHSAAIIQRLIESP